MLIRKRRVVEDTAQARVRFLPMVAATRGTLSIIAENTPITAVRQKQEQEQYRE